MRTNMDVLVIEGCILRKEDQPDAQRIETDAHLAQFALD